MSWVRLLTCRVFEDGKDRSEGAPNFGSARSSVMLVSRFSEVRHEKNWKEGLWMQSLTACSRIIHQKNGRESKKDMLPSMR